MCVSVHGHRNAFGRLEKKNWHIDRQQQQQQHGLDWVESVLLLLQLGGGGKPQRHTAGCYKLLAVSSAAFYVRYKTGIDRHVNTVFEVKCLLRTINSPTIKVSQSKLV